MKLGEKGRMGKREWERESGKGKMGREKDRKAGKRQGKRDWEVEKRETEEKGSNLKLEDERKWTVKGEIAVGGRSEKGGRRRNERRGGMEEKERG